MRWDGKERLVGRPTEWLPDRIEVKQLKGHHRCMARDVAAGGLRGCELSKIYGMTESQISIIMNSPLFVAEVARLEAELEESVLDVKQRLLVHAPRAVNVLGEELNFEVEERDLAARKLRRTAAVDTLKLLGFGKEESGKGLGQGNTFNFVDARKLSTDQLRDNVFDMIEVSGDEG